MSDLDDQPHRIAFAPSRSDVDTRPALRPAIMRQTQPFAREAFYVEYAHLVTAKTRSQWEWPSRSTERRWGAANSSYSGRLETHGNTLRLRDLGVRLTAHIEP
jgi:hypothetical protein